MNKKIKIKLLKRKFQSLSYIEGFIKNYQEFIQIGLYAFERYQQYREKHSNFTPDKILSMEEEFWEHRVKPNFKRMVASSKNTLLKVQNKEKDYLNYLDGLAGDFRGLSRGFDGIREEFMDISTPELRKKYLKLYDLASKQATIIESTINEWWDDDEILNERITGHIDEQELLHYLEPGETVRD